MTLTPAQLDDLKHFLSDVKIGTSTEHDLTSDEAAYLLSLIEQERWVPVSDERKPEDGEEVEVIYIDRYGDRYVGLANYTDSASERYQWSMNGGILASETGDTVTHWRPLPTPPTKEG